MVRGVTLHESVASLMLSTANKALKSLIKHDEHNKRSATMFHVPQILQQRLSQVHKTYLLMFYVMLIEIVNPTWDAVLKRTRVVI